MNSLRFVWKSLNGENADQRKTLCLLFTKNVVVTYFEEISKKNCLNYYILILIIQCNINLLNSFRFVWKSLNGQNAIQRKTLRLLFT